MVRNEYTNRGRNMKKWLPDQTQSVLLALLIAADLAFIGMHLAFSYGLVAANYLYSLEMDRGYAELFQYIKTYWLAIMALLLAFQRRQPVYLGWFLMFGFLLMDDCFSIHEKTGYRMAEALAFGPHFGLRPEDFGEILVLAAAGLILATVIGVFYIRSGTREKAVSRMLFLGLCVMAFFGICIDMVHIMMKDTPLSIPLGTLEDGGEMLTASVLVWLVFRSWRETPREVPGR